MLCINSTPALTILYSMLLLYPSSSYSLFEIKDFPCNCLSRVLRKCLISMSVLWMCMNMIDPSISLTGVMLDLWPHWQQEIRGKNTCRLFWAAMNGLLSSCTLWHVYSTPSGPKPLLSFCFQNFRTERNTILHCNEDRTFQCGNSISHCFTEMPQNPCGSGRGQGYPGSMLLVVLTFHPGKST